MASNPKWCQPLGRWQQYFSECVTAAEPQDLLDVNILFDFRCAYGEASHVALLGTLRRVQTDSGIAAGIQASPAWPGTRLNRAAVASPSAARPLRRWLAGAGRQP